jgi:acetyl-CoA carboxylase biotin carboxyl carrier protein
MSMRLTLDDVREILQLLDDSPYDEMNLQSDRFSVSFRRTADRQWTQETRTAARDDAVAAAAEPATGAAAERGRGEPGNGILTVDAALPGVFYRAPKPGAEPFVAVGSSVEEDSVVAIIETMKLMNSITAGCRGEIVDILVDNGQMVNAGEVLMHVKERVRP